MFTLDSELIRKADAIVQLASKERLPRFRLVLDTLLDRGFSSARLYDYISPQWRPNADFLLLTDSAYRDGPPANALAGYRIPYEQSTIGANPGTACAVSHDGAGDPCQKWVADLGLHEQSWVNLAVDTLAGERVGVLAAAWKGPPDLLSSQDRNALQIVCRLIGFGIEQSFARKVEDTVKKTADSLRQQPFSGNEDVVCNRLARLLCEHTGSRVASFFRYDWASNTLAKVAEATSEGRRVVELPERYEAERYLTGKAWVKEESRFIPDFEAYAAANPKDVLPDNLDRLKKTIGPVVSMMYGQIGSIHNRYLVRLINREDFPAHSHSTLQYSFLKRVCDRLTELLDGLSLRQLNQSVEKAALVGLRRFTEVEHVFRIFVEQLQLVGLDRFIVLHHSGLTSSVDFRFSHGGFLKDIQQGAGIFLTEDDAFSKISAESGLKLVEVAKLKGRSSGTVSEDALYAALTSSDSPSLITVCSRHEHSATVLIAPDLAPKRQGFGVEDRLSPIERGNLDALLAIVAAAIDANASNISAENAELLVSQLGHEIISPIAELANVAIEGINGAILALDHPSMEQRAEALPMLDAAKRKIDAQKTYLNHQMDMALLMAEQSRGNLQLRYESFRWIDVFQLAQVEAKEWANSVLERKSRAPVIVVANDALANMTGVGDVTLIRALMTNLLKNAIKYSLPREHGQPMQIDVRGNPQIGWRMVQVENWGIGIPKSDFETIFRRFHRVKRLDRRRAIAGLGLGLFLARSFAELHGGSVRCVASKPTLDDPDRTADLEGYLTTFEIRIPNDLRPGMHQRPLLTQWRKS